MASNTDTPISYPIVHKPNDTNYYLYRDLTVKVLSMDQYFLDGDNKSNLQKILHHLSLDTILILH